MISTVVPVRELASPKVFISYSHDSPEHETAVLTLADRLRSDGIDANLDQYESITADGWPLWMEKQIREANFILLICTEAYCRKFTKEVPPGEGLGVSWEATFIYQYLYENQGKNERFLPIVLSQ